MEILFLKTSNTNGQVILNFLNCNIQQLNFFTKLKKPKKYIIFSSILTLTQALFSLLQITAQRHSDLNFLVIRCISFIYFPCLKHKLNNFLPTAEKKNANRSMLILCLFRQIEKECQ